MFLVRYVSLGELKKVYLSFYSRIILNLLNKIAGFIFNKLYSKVDGNKILIKNRDTLSFKLIMEK